MLAEPNVLFRTRSSGRVLPNPDVFKIPNPDVFFFVARDGCQGWLSSVFNNAVAVLAASSPAAC